MLRIGYRRCDLDCCVYVRSLDNGSFIFLLLYVNNMLIAANHLRDVNESKTKLGKEFDTKDLGVTKKILGMEIHRDEELINYYFLRKAMLKVF